MVYDSDILINSIFLRIIPWNSTLPPLITLCTWKFIQNIIRMVYDSDILIKYSNVLVLFHRIVHSPPPNYIMYMEIYTEHYKDIF